MHIGDRSKLQMDIMEADLQCSSFEECFKLEVPVDKILTGKDVCLGEGGSLRTSPDSCSFVSSSTSPFCLSDSLSDVDKDESLFSPEERMWLPSPVHDMVKEEKLTLSDEEALQDPETSRVFKVELEEHEEPFNEKHLSCSDYPAHEGVSNNHYTNSPSSGSENFSYSPSPSPPLTSRPQSKAVAATTTVSSVVSKFQTPQSIILSGLPTSSTKGATGGMPLQHIVFIDSRPYQVIPRQNETFPQESQPLQLRVLNQPPQHLQHPPTPLTQPLPLMPPSSQENSMNFENVQPSQASCIVSNGSQQHEVNSQELTENSEDTEEDVGVSTSGVAVSESDYHVDQIQGKEFESQEMESGQSSSQEIVSQSNDCECPIPNLLNDSGPYGFKVLLDAKEDTLKTPTWLVSSITNKLYTNMNKPIPFRVILKKAPPVKRKLNLRAMAVFKYPMFLRQNVVRCPNHLNPLDSTNIDFLYPNHVIRADHPRAVYEASPSGRLSVVVPLDFPEQRAEAIPVLLKFMCHNSCVGGINRRPMAVLLTLEQHDEEMGRYTVDVRVCACPSRDVKTEEKQLITKGLYKKAGHHAFENRRSRKRQRKEDDPSRFDEDQIYYLPVRGATLFNFLQDTKLNYLKHNPEYASRYPDPPMDFKMLEDIPQGSSDFLTEENHPPDSPSSPYPKENSQPVILVYSNIRDKEPHQILSEAELPPEIRLSITDNVRKDNSMDIVRYNSESDSNIKKKVGLSGSDDDRTEEGGPIRHGTGQKASKKFSKAELMKMSNKIKGNPPNGKHKSKMSLTKAQQQLQQRHLLVASMPEKQKGKGLIRILPSHLEDSDTSKLKEALEGAKLNAEAAQEDEKVMLAAHVLASHLGAHQIDK